MPVRYVQLAGFACAVCGLVYWLTLPSPGQLAMESCSPNGAIAEMSGFIHGKLFWQVQIDDVRRRKDRVENWDQATEERDRKIELNREKLRAIVERATEKLYREHPNLAPSEEHQMAGQLREQADDIERAGNDRVVGELMQRTLPTLVRCEAILADKLRQ